MNSPRKKVPGLSWWKEDWWTDKEQRGRGFANGKRLTYLSGLLAESPKQQHNHMDGSSPHLDFMVCFRHSNQTSCYLRGWGKKKSIKIRVAQLPKAFQLCSTFYTLIAKICLSQGWTASSFSMKRERCSGGDLDLVWLFWKGAKSGLEFRREIWEWEENICAYNKGMVRGKFLLQSGRNCYLPHFGDIKSKEENWSETQWCIGMWGPWRLTQVGFRVQGLAWGSTCQLMKFSVQG